MGQNDWDLWIMCQEVILESYACAYYGVLEYLYIHLSRAMR